MVLRSALTASILTVALGLVGCTTAPEASPTPTPTVSAEASTVPDLASASELADTRWLVDDSQGDRTTVKFAADGSIGYTSEGQQFAYPEDTWSVDGNTITGQVTYGARYGVWTCVATFDPATQLITGTWTSTVGESGTLTAKQPVR